MSSIVIDYRIKTDVFYDCNDGNVLVTNPIQFTLSYREIRVILISSVENKPNTESVKKLIIYLI